MESSIAEPILGTEEKESPNRISRPGNLALLFLFALVSGVVSGLANSAKLQIYVPKFGMSIIWGSCVDFLTTVLGVYAGIFISWFGDKVVSRWGRRKPVILVSYSLKMLCAFLLLNPPEKLLHQSKVICRFWYMVTFCGYFAADAIFLISFSSFFVETCVSPEDYKQFVVYSQAIPSILGFLTGAGLSFVSLGHFGAGLVGLAWCLLFAVCVTMPHRVVTTQTVQPPLLSSFRALIRTGEYRTLLANRIAFGASYVVGKEFAINGCFLLFPGVEHFTEYKKLFFLVTIVSTTLSIAGQIAVSVLMRRGHDKVSLYNAGTRIISGLATLQIFFFIPGLLGDPQGSSTLLICWIGFSFGIIGTFFLACNTVESLIFRDVIRWDTFTTGLNRESMYLSAVGVPSDLSTLFIKAVPLTILTLTGFRTKDGDPTDDKFSSKYSWNEGTKIQIALYTTFLFAAGAYYSYVIFKTFPLTSSVADQIEVALKKRARNGDRKDAKSDMVPGMGMFVNEGGGHGYHKDIGEDQLSLLADADAAAGSADHGAHGDHGVDDKPALQQDDVSEIGFLDQGIASIADNKSEMLMLHFSESEVAALGASSLNSAGRLKALEDLTHYHRLGMWFFAPLSVASAGAALGQVLIVENEFSVFIVVIFCLTTVFWLYEFLRMGPISTLRRHSPLDVRLLAKEAARKNRITHESIAELLARNGIEGEILTGEADSRTNSLGGPTSSVWGKETEPLTGYYRTFVFQIAISIGCLFLTIKVQ